MDDLVSCMEAKEAQIRSQISTWSEADQVSFQERQAELLSEAERAESNKRAVAKLAAAKVSAAAKAAVNDWSQLAALTGMPGFSRKSQRNLTSSRVAAFLEGFAKVNFVWFA